MRTRSILLYTALVCVSLCGRSSAQSYHTVVAIKASENIAEPCHFSFEVPEHLRYLSYTWVLYDRGPDTLKFFQDSEVRQFAAKHSMALLFARHCKAKDSEDIDLEPGNGLGRVLVSAIDELAVQSMHPEVRRSKLVIFGFSGTGTLAPRLAELLPKRVVALILANPAQSDPLGIDSIKITKRQVRIPQLVIANGGDRVAGTQRPYDYIQKGLSMGAPWLFVIQPNGGHCCFLNSKSLMLALLESMLGQRFEPKRKIGFRGFIALQKTDTFDTWKERTSIAVRSSVNNNGASTPIGYVDAGWIPDANLIPYWQAILKAEEKLD